MKTFFLAAALVVAVAALPAQQMVTETRDPAQAQDEDFAKSVKEWTTEPYFISPLVDHLPKVPGIPSPKDVLGYHIGAPAKLTYYADILKYYRALAAATPRVKIETIGKSDEDRELVVVWVSSDENIRNLQQNRDNLAKIADPRGLSSRSDQAAHRDDQAALSLHGRPAQRRDRPVRDADGAGLPARDRDVAAHQADSRQRHRLDHAGGRSRRPRSQRRLVLPGARAAAAPAAAERAGRRDRRGAAARRPGGGGEARGSCRTGASTSTTTTTATSTCRRCRCARSSTGTSPRIRRSCTTCTRRSRCSTPTAAARRRIPNLDPILFAELPFFSNFELAQMTKWGMPGVYTHAFMDGWSPGYLGSVAYNHNGMMRMYETQSGVKRDGRSRRAVTRRAGGAAAETARRPLTRRTRAEPAAPSARTRGTRAHRTRRLAAARVVSRPADSAGRGRELLAPQQHELHGDRRALGAAAHGDVPEPRLENFYREDAELDRRGQDASAPYGYVIPVQRDMTRVADARQHPARRSGSRSAQANAEIKIGDGTFPAGSYVIKRDQPYGRLAKNLLEQQNYPDPEPHAPTTTAAGRWGWRCCVDVKEIKDKAILDVPVTPVKEAAVQGQVTGTGTRRHRGRALRLEQHDRLPLQAEERADEDRREELHGRRRRVPGRLVRHRGRRRPRARCSAAVEQLGLTAAALSAAADRADARRRRCRASRSTRPWSGTQEIGWVPPRVRQVRHSLRPDLQGARRRRATCAPTTT